MQADLRGLMETCTLKPSSRVSKSLPGPVFVDLGGKDFSKTVAVLSVLYSAPISVRNVALIGGKMRDYPGFPMLRGKGGGTLPQMWHRTLATRSSPEREKKDHTVATEGGPLSPVSHISESKTQQGG